MQQNTMEVKDKLYLSWKDIEKCVNKLCNRILLSNIPVNTVHGLKRGGYIPAVMISHKLKMPYSEVVLKDTLVIDDICDTGKTLNESPGWMHAVLHYKPTANFTPLCWGKEIGEEWIVYPWEREDSKPIQDYLK